MRVQLWGAGQTGKSPAITAQARVNCITEMQEDVDRTRMAIIGLPGKTLFKNMGASPSRGLWPVNTLSTPVFFTVHNGTLYKINSAGASTTVGTIGTTTGNVSMADNGTHLVIVDGAKGYYYNMVSPGALTEIMDGNFTETPATVSWQDTYFIVTSGADNQWQLSDGEDVTTWPAENIGFTGAAPGALQAGIADHSIVNLFGDVYAEFWQNAGSADFPYASIPGSSKEFGLASPWSMFKYDNSVAGLFRNKMGEVNMSRLSGFSLDRMSNFELESIINGYDSVDDCVAFGYMLDGHPLAQFNFPTAGKSWLYDSTQKDWCELKDSSGGRDWGNKFCNFQDMRLVSDYRNGNIYRIDPDVYTNNGDILPMEVTSKHIWNDDKQIGISFLQVDIQSGVGTATGQGENPQIMLFISKDGGTHFTETAWSSMGKIGKRTTRIVWRTLGAAPDWVLRLRITDPVMRVITGASAEIEKAGF